MSGARIAVVVLGDLGRSPRMLYQALSLADSGAAVDLVGYRGSEPPRAVAGHPRIRLHRLPAPRRLEARRGSLLWLDAVLRLVAQSVRLLWILLARLPRPSAVLVQNPPPIPTLPAAWLAARLRRARWVVDWHNLGPAVLAETLGARHPLIAAARRCERVFGRRADAHLCVSRALADALAARRGIAGAAVLYDRPPPRFAPTPAAGRAALLRRLGLDRLDPSRDDRDRDRPALAVSPTSWTPDEDFTPLLDALARYDAAAAGPQPPRLPPLVVAITGRGPLRERWRERFAALGLSRVAVHTPWLEADDYPLLLGAADLGLCFHRSSSGLDLPMKLADLRGAGLPVCALDYGPVLAEVVRDGDDGLLFAGGERLAGHLIALLAGFPAPNPLRDRLRRGAAEAARIRWHDGWEREARPALERLVDLGVSSRRNFD